MALRKLLQQLEVLGSLHYMLGIECNLLPSCRHPRTELLKEAQVRRKAQVPRKEQVLGTRGLLGQVLLLEEYIPDTQHYCPADLSTDIW